VQAETDIELGNLDGARKLIDEGRTLAKSGELLVYLPEFDLADARLAVASGDLERAGDHLERARRAVTRMGFGLRDRDIRQVAALLDRATNSTDAEQEG
jgi:ATP/maltotriose-dependent transcriptional regulator MalT